MNPATKTVTIMLRRSWTIGDDKTGYVFTGSDGLALSVVVDHTPDLGRRDPLALLLTARREAEGQWTARMRREGTRQPKVVFS